MSNNERLTEMVRPLGTIAADIEAGRQFLDAHGNLSQPYDAEEGFNDLAEVARSLLETKMKIDWFVDTLPKKQQAIYAQTIKERQKKQ